MVAFVFVTILHVWYFVLNAFNVKGFVTFKVLDLF